MLCINRFGFGNRLEFLMFVKKDLGRFLAMNRSRGRALSLYPSYSFVFICFEDRS